MVSLADAKGQETLAGVQQLLQSKAEEVEALRRELETEQRACATVTVAREEAERGLLTAAAEEGALLERHAEQERELLKLREHGVMLVRGHI
eukprot:SAG11_NODE_1425_length_4944_cov_3.856966_3_plen_92_part_00